MLRYKHRVQGMSDKMAPLDIGYMLWAQVTKVSIGHLEWDTRFRPLVTNRDQVTAILAWGAPSAPPCGRLEKKHDRHLVAFIWNCYGDLARHCMAKPWACGIICHNPRESMLDFWHRWVWVTTLFQAMGQGVHVPYGLKLYVLVKPEYCLKWGTRTLKI